MDRVFLGVFVMIFVVIICFIMLNTVMSTYVFPVFDEVKNSTTFMNESLNTFNYDQQAEFFQTIFFTALYIVIIIPFLYIFVRILKREPEPQPYGYGG